MPRTRSKHSIQTKLGVDLGEVGPYVELPACVEWTYHPGDNRGPRITDLEPPDEECVEDVRITVNFGDTANPNWRQISDRAIEAFLLRSLDEDLVDISRGERQADYEDALRC